MIKKLAWLLGVAIVFLALTPITSLACPICFGDPDSPVAQGVNWAVFTLLGITGGVLSAFVGFIVHLIKRSKLALVQESKILNQSESGGRL
jgi:hypothetical protein